MHFHPDEILLGRRGGHLQRGMPHAETDFEGAWRLSAEYLVEITHAVGQFQAEARPALVQPALLAFGHAPGAHHEAFDGAHTALAVGRGDDVTHERTCR